MSETKVITSKVRFSYVHVFEPQSHSEGDKKKYSVSILIPKTSTNLIKKLKKAIEAAYQEGKAKYGGKLPKKWKNPLRDGDEEREDSEEYAGHMFISAKANRKPGIIDKDKQQIEDPEEFYSGCYGKASINFYAYNWEGSKGVACGLNNLMKTSDGERLSGGGVSAEEDFADA